MRPGAVTQVTQVAQAARVAQTAQAEPVRWRERLDGRLGLWRSLLIYHSIPGRGAQLRRFYRRFVPPGGLAFDIGAHTGNRVDAFRALGARVVALEPQPDFARRLQHRHRADPQVIVRAEAAGRAAGHATLLASARTATVSTLSPEFVHRAGATAGFRGVRWATGPPVPVTTLDAMIARHGRPDFVKIDVEGYEHEVLLGLGAPLPALSFEFVPALADVALACVDRLEALAAGAAVRGADPSRPGGPIGGGYRYAVSLGETLTLLHGGGLAADPMREWLQAWPADAPSGDVHAWWVAAGSGPSGRSAPRH